MLGIGLLLWFYAKRISNLLIAHKQVEEEQNIHFQMTYTMLISISGLFIVLYSISQLLYSVPSFFHSYADLPYTNQFLYGFIADFIRLGMGFWLIFGADGIRKLLIKAAKASLKS
jgi:hypothetical protein